MWAQTHPSVSGRTGGALPQASERPSLANNVTPLRAGGTGAGAGPAGPAASGAAPSGPAATSNATTRTNNHPSLVSASSSSSSARQQQQQQQQQHQQQEQQQQPQLPTIVGSGGTFLLVDDLPTAESRDSFASIVEDPFFFRYHTPGLDPEPEPCRAPASASAPTAAPEPALRSALPSAPSTSAGHRDEERQPWIPPRKESLSHSNPTPWFEHASAPSDMEPINIAIIGAVGVGKSTFIQQLRRAPRPSALNITTLRQEVDGAPYLVTLVELDLEGIELDPNQPVHWPKQIGGHSMPRMDGALILYDAVNEGSMREVPPIMAALDNSSLPTLLVATKCDTPDDLRHPDLSGLAQAFATCAGHLRTASNAPASARECLQTMLRVALANRKDKSEGGGGHRRRAASTANLDAPMDPHNGRPISQHSKHSRASSDFSLLRGFSQPASESQFRGPAPRSPRPDYQSTSSSNLSYSTAIPEDGGPPTVSNMLRTPGIRLDGGGETFLDVDESDGESYRSDDIPILQRSDDGFDKPAKLAGVSFGELVDRLLAPKMSKADQNFADVFLCLYRKFSTPSGLLAAIRARLDQLWTGRGGEYLLKIEAQMRIIEVAAKWLSLYPGDFARPATRRSLEELIKQLSTDPVFVAAAQQMRVHLEQKVTVDDDTSWAKSDPDEDQQEGGGGGGADQRQSGMAESMGSLHLDGSTLASARRPSQSSDLSGIEPRGAQGPARLQFHSVEDYEAEAATLIPSGILPLNKYRYHLFMELDVDDIANEMTRIDWIMFSSIRIRDMVRHVSLSHDAKTKCRHLKNVDRMVSHFNHVAQWVANIVLLRDKAKHRAPCLEKLMSVALRLRQMNNYNGLAAVLAGINGTAVHRLASTRSLVTASVQKRFAGLELLMGTQKSHFAYRLAWENSPLPRIPFMPLHRRDLVSAEEGSKTFVGSGGDRVNWKKFEVLGEVLLPIMKSQGQPYPNLLRNDVCKELVLDCRMSTDDEDIYQRSLQVEPTSGSGGALEATRKKFPWLAK